MKCECSEVSIYYNLLEFYSAPKYKRYMEKWSYRILNALVHLPEIQNNDELYTNILLIFIAFLRDNFENVFQSSRKINDLSEKDKRIAQTLLKSCII